MLSTFLKAQEESPTLVLAHAAIGDAGALEIAGFLATNRHLLLLDLTGCDLTATAAMHLAGAMRQNHTLESLILKHNRIGEGGEAGLAALCRAVNNSLTLKHLDLRQNSLDGTLAAQCLGEMLQNNKCLTHLELSWNPLDPSGGTVLHEHLKMNTTLFDCQLSGCRIPEETLLGIAQLLLRNRKAKRADLQAGPYKVAVEPRDFPNANPYQGREHALTNSIVSADRTNELGWQSATLMAQLLRFRSALAPTGGEARRAQEFYEYLEQAQKQLQMEVGTIGRVRERVELLSQGFNDREVRYRGDIAEAQDRLEEFVKDHKEIRAVISRFAEQLQLEREAKDELVRDLDRDERRYEAEEARSKNDLAVVLSEQKELSRRLKELQLQSEEMDKENRRLHERADKLREGVTLLHT